MTLSAKTGTRTRLATVLAVFALAAAQAHADSARQEDGQAAEAVSGLRQPAAGAPAKKPAARKMHPQLARGVRALLAGEQKLALESFEAYVVAAPDDAEGHFWAGTALSELDQTDRAIESFKKAIELNDRAGVDVAQLRVNYGNALVNLGRYDEAIREYRRAIQVDPSEPRAHFNLGRAYLRKESPFMAAMALPAFSRAEKLGLNMPSLRKFRAEAFVRLHMHERARRELTAYLTDLPSRADTTELRSRVKEMIDKLAEAPVLPDGPVPAKRRRYSLDKNLAYVIVDSDSIRHMLTLTSEDEKDPDGGLQDGSNDGFFEMTMEDFHSQVSGTKSRADRP